MRRNDIVIEAYLGETARQAKAADGMDDLLLDPSAAAHAAGSTMSVALEITDLTAGHGGVPAVRDLSLSVAEGELVALLGPNGAGKSTTLWTIAGVLRPLGGTIEILGQPPRNRSTHAVARLGVSLVPEDRGLFYQLSVAENIRLHHHRASRVTAEQVFGYFPALARLVRRKAGLLSGGEQQMLALGCALVSGPDGC